ncbi:ACT domain-containing protein [Actinomycetospora sp. TBRC 11914]|uniref:ACT domain-containing protein n=1 Tax=Actinomycetospora sp. TBRC 11914 TaxID=2729387 RepID=UPI00145F9C96|nr:ACT domain-containing protein [Actinomycetospora sp. TBRC 11914]NMO93779.1 ACT domain-containing protein [Actinomycetospora sp. TBRC 11914]
MSGLTDPGALLAGMTPRLRPGRYVFATVPDDGRAVPGAVMTLAEDEGTTVVVPAEATDGLDAEYPCGWITLEVRSSLAAVGFLAAVTRALADAGISANPVSGFHHDHLFVPWDRRHEAVAVLERLAAGASSST